VSAKSAGSAATHDRLAALMSPVIRAAGYDLEDLVLTPMGRRSLLRVVIDRDEGISLDDVAGLSRAVADVLDEDEGVIGRSPYVLEVTSPGVDRPLTEPRHWRRALDRLVRTKVGDSMLEGRVVAADDNGVDLDIGGSSRAVPYDLLGPGSVQVEFARREGGDR